MSFVTHSQLEETMTYSDDMTRPRDWWQEDMDPAEEARIMAAIRARAAARRRRRRKENTVALLAWASGTGLVLGLIYYWRAN